MMNTNKTEQELKTIFCKIARDFELNDDDSEIIIWDKLVEKRTNFEQGYIIKTKIYNFLKMMNEKRNESVEEFNIFTKRDIETDIWYIV